MTMAFGVLVCAAPPLCTDIPPPSGFPFSTIGNPALAFVNAAEPNNSALQVAVPPNSSLDTATTAKATCLLCLVHIACVSISETEMHSTHGRACRLAP